MYQKPLIKATYPFFLFSGMLSRLAASGQFTFSGQLRTRTEFCDEFDTLKPLNKTPSFYSSQRTSLTFNYQVGSIRFQTLIHDVRVWGQDTSIINIKDGNRLSIHEVSVNVVVSNHKVSSPKVSMGNLNKSTYVEIGFIMTTDSNSIEYIKNNTPGSSHLKAYWSYVQPNIMPDLIFN